MRTMLTMLKSTLTMVINLLLFMCCSRATLNSRATVALSKLHKKFPWDRFDDVLRCLTRISRSESEVLIAHLLGLLPENRLVDGLLAALALSPPPSLTPILGAARYLHTDGDIKRVLDRVAAVTSDDALIAINKYLHEGLTDGARQERKGFMQRVSLLTPLIGRFGGELALAETVEAIADVGMMWP